MSRVSEVGPVAFLTSNFFFLGNCLPIISPNPFRPTILLSLIGTFGYLQNLLKRFAFVLFRCLFNVLYPFVCHFSNPPSFSSSLPLPSLQLYVTCRMASCHPLSYIS